MAKTKHEILFRVRRGEGYGKGAYEDGDIIATVPQVDCGWMPAADIVQWLQDDPDNPTVPEPAEMATCSQAKKDKWLDLRRRILAGKTDQEVIGRIHDVGGANCHWGRRDTAVNGVIEMDLDQADLDVIHAEDNQSSVDYRAELDSEELAEILDDKYTKHKPSMGKAKNATGLKVAKLKKRTIEVEAPPAE